MVTRASERLAEVAMSVAGLAAAVKVVASLVALVLTVVGSPGLGLAAPLRKRASEASWPQLAILE